MPLNKCFLFEFAIIVPNSGLYLSAFYVFSNLLVLFSVTFELIFDSDFLEVLIDSSRILEKFELISSYPCSSSDEDSSM